MILTIILHYNWLSTCIIGINKNRLLFVFPGHKIIGSPVFIIPSYVDLARAWNPAKTYYSIAMTFYFLPSSHLFTLQIWEILPPPSHCSMGWVMMVKSDNKIWMQTKGSSVPTGCLMDLQLQCGFHLFIIPSKNKKLFLSVGLPVCPLNCPPKLPIGFPLSVFGHCSRSLASVPDHHGNHLV
jgi:hypothetical protein